MLLLERSIYKDTRIQGYKDLGKKKTEKKFPRLFREILFFTSLDRRNTFRGLKTSKIKFSGHTFFL